MQSGRSPDPFDIFHTPAKAHSSVGAPHAGQADLLGGFEGSLGTVPIPNSMKLSIIAVQIRYKSFAYIVAKDRGVGCHMCP